MPANFIETPFGIGISFPHKPMIPDQMRRLLKEKGFRKPSSVVNHWLTEDTPLNRKEAEELAENYNKAYY